MAPSTACRHLLPEGRREIAATSPFLAHLSQGTSPLPVFTGVRRTGRDEWLDPAKVRVRGSHSREG
ncbi:hypothetical protein E0H57_30605 [Rhizobium leguminosarum bv. viciae]|nr:hypothetical protein E0H57_30605 [Rhizobium leguminosarum bv. viciae]